MNKGVIHIDSARQIDSLVNDVGTIEECHRLGFIVQDEQGIAHLTGIGLGYLLYVRTRDIKSVAEAFAAGFQCAKEEG